MKDQHPQSSEDIHKVITKNPTGERKENGRTQYPRAYFWKMRLFADQQIPFHYEFLKIK